MDDHHFGYITKWTKKTLHMRRSSSSSSGMKKKIKKTHHQWISSRSSHLVIITKKSSSVMSNCQKVGVCCSLELLLQEGSEVRKKQKPQNPKVTLDGWKKKLPKILLFFNLHEWKKKLAKHPSLLAYMGERKKKLQKILLFLNLHGWKKKLAKTS